MINTIELFGDLEGYYNEGIDIRESSTPLYHLKGSGIPFPMFMYMNLNAREGDVEYFQMLDLRQVHTIRKTYNDIYQAFYSDKTSIIRLGPLACSGKFYFVGKLSILEYNTLTQEVKVLLCLVDNTGLYDRSLFLNRMRTNHEGACELCISNDFVNHSEPFIARLYKNFEKNHLPKYRQYCDVTYRLNLNKYLFPYGSIKKFSSVKERLDFDSGLYKYLDLNYAIHGEQKQDSREQLGITVQKDINELHKEMEQYLNIETGEQEDGRIRSGLSEHREVPVPV